MYFILTKTIFYNIYYREQLNCEYCTLKYYCEYTWIGACEYSGPDRIL